MEFYWSDVIGILLRDVDGAEVTEFAAWMMIAAAGGFLILQALISYRNVYLSPRRLSRFFQFLETNIGKTGLPKANLHEEIEYWIRDHFLLEMEDDEHIVLSRKNRRFLVRDMRGMIPLVKPSPLRFVPALLTTLGILGTFIGISIGLVDFDPSKVGENTGALMGSSVDMLIGMKTAFYTSLIGMFCSVVFTILGLAGITAIERRYVKRAGTLVRRKCMEALPVDYLVSFDPELQKQTLAAQLSAAENNQIVIAQLGAASQQIAEAMSGFSSDSIVRGVADAFQGAVDRELKPVFVQIANEMELLREIKQDNGEELIRVLTTSIREDVVAPLSVEISRTCEAVNAANGASNALASKLDEVMGGFSEAIKTIASFQTVTMDKLTRFADSLKTVLDEFRSETTAVMDRVSEEVAQALQSSIDGMSDQRQAFLESSKQAADSFRGIREELELALDTRTRAEAEMLEERLNIEQKMFEGVRSGIEQLLGEAQGIFKEQNDVLATVGREAGSVMSHAREELARGLGDIDSKVLAMSTAVQKELESFRVEYQNRLTSFFNDQNLLIEQALERQRGTLEGVIDDYRRTFEEDHQRRLDTFKLLSESHSELQQSAQTVQALTENIGMLDASTMSALQSVASEIGRQAGLLGRHYGEASQSFAEMTDQLPKAMNEYFERANKSYEMFFNDFDKAAGTIHQRLAEAANYLVTAAVEQKRLELREVGT